MSAALLNPTKAAEYLGISLRTFQRHVQPSLKDYEVTVGKKPRYQTEDLDRWVAEHKGTGSRGSEGGRSSALRTRDTTTASRLAQETLEKLRRARPTSTPALFLVSGGAPPVPELGPGEGSASHSTCSSPSGSLLVKAR